MCGIDPGVRVPFTSYTGDKIVRYKHDREKQEKLQLRLDLFRSLRERKKIRFKTYSRRRKRIKNRWEDLRKVVNCTTKDCATLGICNIFKFINLKMNIFFFTKIQIYNKYS